MNLINEVYCMDARKLLSALPSESIDSTICDPMYMVAQKKGKNCIYDWGVEPGHGEPHEWLDYHKNIYEECRRVLKPHGTLAWAMGCKFEPYFPQWFGGYRIWGLSRFCKRGLNAFGHIWIVQTREQTPIAFPDDDALVIVGPPGWWRDGHPCPKSVEEMRFLARHLSQPGQIVLDCFCGTGSTLVAAEQLGRQWIGCDLSLRYCQIALKRIADLRAGIQDVVTSVPRSIRRPTRSQVTSDNGTHHDLLAKVDTSTPQWLFDILNEQVRKLTGKGFVLDAAAADWNAKCTVYFDVRMDGLKQDWSRYPTIYCNPPFSVPEIGKFVYKALEAAEVGSTVVLVLPNWPRYPWFQELKRRGQMQDVITPVAFEWPDGEHFLLNKDQRTSIVVATLGPNVTPGTNGAPIEKRTSTLTATEGV